MSLIRGVDRLFQRCLEPPLAHKRGGARHIVRLYRGIFQGLAHAQS